MGSRYVEVEYSLIIHNLSILDATAMDKRKGTDMQRDATSTHRCRSYLRSNTP